MSTLVMLLDHAAWADARAHSAIRDMPADSPQRAEAIRLYAHLAAAEHIWLSRLEGRAPIHAIWPELTLDAAFALSVESLDGLRAIAAAGSAESLARDVEYRNSSGKTFRNTVADVLSHAALHGGYHRGQIALLIRAGGGTPLATDYIVFVREP